MFDTVKTLNKRVSDWQIQQVKLANKATADSVTHTLGAFEASLEAYAAMQQEWLTALDTTTAK